MPKVVRFHETGGPEVLKFEEVPLQEPGKGEVRLRVQAIGLNRAESMFYHGRYVYPPKLPAGLGYEAAGRVEAVGPDAKTFPFAQTVDAYNYLESNAQVGKVVATVP